MANNRIAVLVALEGSDDGLKRALTSAQQSLGELATNAKTAGEKAAAGMAEVKAGMKWTPKTGQQFKWDTVTRNGVNHDRDQKAQRSPAGVQSQGGA